MSRAWLLVLCLLPVVACDRIFPYASPPARPEARLDRAPSSDLPGQRDGLADGAGRDRSDTADKSGADGPGQDTARDARPSDVKPQDMVSPTLSWLKTSASSGLSASLVPKSVAVDSNGNSYVTGYFQGEVDFGGLLSSNGLAHDAFLASFGPSGSVRFANALGGTGADMGASVAVDGAGNIYLTGVFTGKASFAGGSATSKGGSDVFLASYGSSGSYRFVTAMGGAAADAANGLAVDAAGNSHVVGSFQGAAAFGTWTLNSNGPYDGFVASLDSSGAVHSAKALGGTGSDVVMGAAVDGSGNIYLTGRFENTVLFDAVTARSSKALSDVFLASYGPTGSLRFATSFGGAAYDEGRGVAVDGSGNSYITGHFTGPVDFGAGSVSGKGGNDVFVVSYGSTGSLRFVQTAGAASTDHGNAVAVDASGNSYVTGVFTGTVDFGSGPVTSSGGDVFLVSYGPSGGLRFVKTFGGVLQDTGHGVAARGSGVHLAGTFQGTADFGQGPLTGKGLTDGFLLHVNAP